ncbi:hypothetical protein PGB90_009118 [Kerria lacca]
MFQSNLYLCTPVKINPEKSYYIVGFEPNASMKYIHHMILYGCLVPGRAESAWNCGEMAQLDYNKDSANPCHLGSTILYAWARDAPKLELPEDVAFKIGRNTKINYLVLQVHYNQAEHFKNGMTDNSGVYLHYTETPLPKLAAVLLMGTSGFIPAGSTESMETNCVINEDKVMHPFAFRTHTHNLGVRVSGYRIRIINDKEHWTLIGQRDPLTPQMFYPVEKNMIIQKDDMVAASCKMDATKKDHYTVVGPTGEDEMCNFYLMYWVEDSSPLEQQYCFTSGPPYYHWRQQFHNIPFSETIEYRRKYD